jgi:hypothetical protein
MEFKYNKNQKENIDLIYDQGENYYVIEVTK